MPQRAFGPHVRWQCHCQGHRYGGSINHGKAPATAAVTMKAPGKSITRRWLHHQPTTLTINVQRSNRESQQAAAYLKHAPARGLAEATADAMALAVGSVAAGRVPEYFYVIRTKMIVNGAGVLDN
jgi:hypothetical protein